jgi:predicted PurR-regulated permease PerM
MKTKQTNNLVKRLGYWALIVIAILLIPYVGGFPWTLSDFIFAGIVLYGCAAVYELLTKQMANKTHRIAVGAVVVLLLLLIWGWAVA